MTTLPCVLSPLQQLAGALLTFLLDAVQYFGLYLRLLASLAVENAVLRNQERIPLGLSRGQ
jgi:hypothetical protein